MHNPPTKQEYKEHCSHLHALLAGRCGSRSRPKHCSSVNKLSGTPTTTSMYHMYPVMGRTSITHESGVNSSSWNLELCMQQIFMQGNAHPSSGSGIREPFRISFLVSKTIKFLYSVKDILKVSCYISRSYRI